MAARTLTFGNPGVRSEGWLRLLHEAAGQQLEGALLEAVRPEQAAPDGAEMDRAVHCLPRPKQQLQGTLVIPPLHDCLRLVELTPYHLSCLQLQVPALRKQNHCPAGHHVCWRYILASWGTAQSLVM